MIPQTEQENKYKITMVFVCVVSYVLILVSVISAVAIILHHFVRVIDIKILYVLIDLMVRLVIFSPMSILVTLLIDFKRQHRNSMVYFTLCNILIMVMFFVILARVKVNV